MNRVLSCLVEGDLDEAVARRLIAAAGLGFGLVYGKRGATYVVDRATGFARASSANPILALVDLMDTRWSCAPAAVRGCVLRPAPTFLMRVVVREIESWVLADRAGLAGFLAVAVPRIPTDPEGLRDPKRTLIEIARHSRSRRVREGLVPRPSSGAREGPTYTRQLSMFVRDSWSPETAERAAPSLRRCRAALAAFAGRRRGSSVGTGPSDGGRAH